MLWETTTDAGIILDEHSMILAANPGLERMLGHPVDSLVGQSLAVLQPERLRGCLWASCATSAACSITHAVNLSAATLGDPAFAGFIRQELARTGIPANCLSFEITETAAIANFTGARHLIDELRGIGCKFALDDFGSGMSSFAYLKHLPVDSLKIDGAFVRDIATDPIARAMVASINEIGHLMGLETIAEFVESEAILAELKAIGVDFAQGFGLARPAEL